MSAETGPTAAEQLLHDIFGKPATPDASEGLTEAEREALWHAYQRWEEGDDFGEHMGRAVETILTARITAAVEQERAARLALVAKIDRLIDWLCDCGDFDGHPGDCAATPAILILSADDTKATS